MAEASSRIERANSYREPEPQAQHGRTREKVRRKSAPAPLESGDQAPAEPEEQEKHELDTLA